jgi:error-prone DNA polymerase
LAVARLQTCEQLARSKNGARATLAGLVLLRQRPGTAKGTLFVTLEDETGIANLIVWPHVFEAYRPVVLGARLLQVEGQVQREASVVHVIVRKLFDRSALLATLVGSAPAHYPSRDFR